MTRQAWLRRQSRNRNIVSFAITAGAYFIAFLVIWALGLLKVEEISEYSGPLQIKLGAAQGMEESSFMFDSGNQEQLVQNEAAPNKIPVEEAAPEIAEKPETAQDDIVSKKTITIASPSAKPSERPSATPKPKPKTTPKPSSLPSAKPSARPSPKPSAAVADAEPKTASSPGITSSENSSASASAVSDKTVVVKGSEQGNAYETNLEAGSTIVGRGLYVPIYLYLPLPYDIDAAIYNAIPKSTDGFNTADDRKSFFKKYYKESNGNWRLKAPVDNYDDRPSLWIMLNDSGYKVSKADYKEGKYLRPVIIRFKVSAGKGGKVPALESVEIEKSSGYSDIDDSVLYGFRKAAFYNNGDKTVTGRFTYSFE